MKKVLFVLLMVLWAGSAIAAETITATVEAINPAPDQIVMYVDGVECSSVPGTQTTISCSVASISFGPHVFWITSLTGTTESGPSNHMIYVNPMATPNVMWSQE